MAIAVVRRVKLVDLDLAFMEKTINVPRKKVLQPLERNPFFRDIAPLPLINFFSTDDPNRYAGLTTLLGALELLGGAVQVVVVGAPGDAAAQGLADAALAAGGPNLVLSRVCAGDTLPQGHPAHGKGLVNGAAAAYVCRNFTCGLPATRPGDLRGQLAAR